MALNVKPSVGTPGQRLLRQVDSFVDMLQAAYGPGGRYFQINRGDGNPLYTRRGKAIIRALEPELNQLGAGALLIRKAALKTSWQSGDGSITTAILARTLLMSGREKILLGHSPDDLVRGIVKSAGDVVSYLRDQALSARDPVVIEKISRNLADEDDELGGMVAKAFNQLGGEGIVDCEDSGGEDSSARMVSGIKFEGGYLTSQFCTEDSSSAIVFRNALLLLCDGVVSDPGTVVPALRKAMAVRRPLVIIAQGFSTDVRVDLLTCALSRSCQNVPVVVEKAPKVRRTVMNDVAAVTGGQVLEGDTGRRLQDVVFAHLGKAGKVIVTRNRSTIMAGWGNRQSMRERCYHLAMGKRPAEHSGLRPAARDTHRLSDGAVMLRLGAESDYLRRQREARGNDMCRTLNSGFKFGFLPGGGTTLLHAGAAIEEGALSLLESNGADALRRALKEPLRVILQNAGRDAPFIGRILEDENSTRVGFNASLGSSDDLVKAGVLDSAFVVETSLINAVSAATSILGREVKPRS